MRNTDATREAIIGLIEDVNIYEIRSHYDDDSLISWLSSWQKEMRKAILNHERMVCAAVMTETVVAITKKQEEILKHE